MWSVLGQNRPKAGQAQEQSRAAGDVEIHADAPSAAHRPGRQAFGGQGLTNPGQKDRQTVARVRAISQRSGQGRVGMARYSFYHVRVR